MKSELGIVSVATPCTQPWAKMKGDARVRHCGQCNKNVYSLDQLTTAEVRELVVRMEGKLCWRFWVRKDGTVLTKDCPVGVAALRRRVIFAIASAAAMALAIVSSALEAWGAQTPSQVVGWWAQRLSLAATPPTPLVSDLPANHGGKGKMQNFGMNNSY